MILAVLQARTGSTRLPGKVLAPILGHPMLARQIERIGRSQRIDRIVLATTIDASDDPVEKLAGELEVGSFRGSVDDVLDRIVRAARPASPDAIVRITGDCPLLDPALVDEVIARHLECEADYTSNALHPTWPDGLDVEVIRPEALEQAWREATKPSEREHVTPFLYEHPERFRIESVEGPRDLSALRWTVDEPADLEFVRAVYEELYPGNPAFTTDDILALLDRRSDLQAGNAHITRNEGYIRGTQADGRGAADES